MNLMSPKARKVVVTQKFFDAQTVSYLRSNGCDVVIAELPPGQADRNLPPELLLQWLQGASGWIVGHARVTRELLHDLPELQIISRRGVGYERVDVAAVRELYGTVLNEGANRGILVTTSHAMHTNGPRTNL